jgi:hypothetical protein
VLQDEQELKPGEFVRFYGGFGFHFEPTPGQ